MDELKEIREALELLDSWRQESALAALSRLEAREAEAPKVSFNKWWLSLSDGQRSAWMEDKWQLADLAFQAGARLAAPKTVPMAMLAELMPEAFPTERIKFAARYGFQVEG